MTTPHPIPDEVLQAAERMKRCHAGENPYFVYAPEKFGKSWSLDDENRFQRIRREDYETLARAFVAALSHQAEPVSDAKCPRDHDKDGNCDRHPFGCPSYAELDRQNGEWRKIVNSLREQDTKQSAEIARLERENATYHADATEAVQLMIEAQKKRDEFRRAANEAKRELAAITASERAYKAHVAAYNMNGGAATGQVLSSRESFGLSPPPTDHAREAAEKQETPWDIACEWYGEDEIYRSLRQLYEHSPGELNPVPQNVFSKEFARWLTHQYRLAMSKGIQLGQGDFQSAITAATAEKDAEIAKLEIDRDNWQASFTRLQAELAEAKGGSAR